MDTKRCNILNDADGAQDDTPKAEIVTDAEWQKMQSVIHSRHDVNRLKDSQGRSGKHANANKKFMQRLTNQMSGMRW